MDTFLKAGGVQAVLALMIVLAFVVATLMQITLSPTFINVLYLAMGAFFGSTVPGVVQSMTKQ